VNIFLEEAKKQAKKAADSNEVPIGAVVVRNDMVIAKAHNRREKKQSATAHAEILAINKACAKLKSWRLDDCQLYVTLTPCPMCAGAIIASRIKQVFIGASSPEQELIENIFKNNKQNHTVNATHLNDTDCENLLKNFFKNKR